MPSFASPLLRGAAWSSRHVDLTSRALESPLERTVLARGRLRIPHMKVLMQYGRGHQILIECPLEIGTPNGVTDAQDTCWSACRSIAPMARQAPLAGLISQTPKSFGTTTPAAAFARACNASRCRGARRQFSAASRLSPLSASARETGKAVRLGRACLTRNRATASLLWRAANGSVSA